MKKIQTLFISLFLACMAFNAFADDDEFVPAYQNEGEYKLEDPDKYFAYEEGRTYYTSGKKNGIRVNENDEKSTDETIGILTLLIAPATIIYMNLVGWWE
tara:strand:+ start:903 stop:1202 length:300 start_codon:yes stop_codon:yes gene_type:complete